MLFKQGRFGEAAALYDELLSPDAKLPPQAQQAVLRKRIEARAKMNGGGGGGTRAAPSDVPPQVRFEALGTSIKDLSVSAAQKTKAVGDSIGGLLVKSPAKAKQLAADTDVLGVVVDIFKGAGRTAKANVAKTRANVEKATQKLLKPTRRASADPTAASTYMAPNV